MKKYVLSASTAENIAKRCPALLDFKDQKIPEDPSAYEAGTTAHAIMEAIQLFATEKKRKTVEYAVAEVIAEDVVKKIIRASNQERHPVGIMRALEGKRIALGFVRGQCEDGVFHIDPSAIPEVDIAVDDNWNVVHSDSATKAYRGRLDLLTPPHTEEYEDGYEITVADVTDYKTAWPTDSSELLTYQFCMYTLLVIAKYPHVTAVRRRVINLRTGGIFEDLMWTDDDAKWRFEQWKNDLAMLRDFASKSPRPANPGRGCIGCPAILHCKHAMLEADTIEDIARQTLATGARYDALIAKGKNILRDQEPIRLDGVVSKGDRYGWHTKTEKTPVPNIGRKLVALSIGGTPEEAIEKHPVAIDMLDAAGLTCGNVKNFTRRVFPAKTDARTRKEIENSLLNDVQVVRYGLHKSEEDVPVEIPDQDS